MLNSAPAQAPNDDGMNCVRAVLSAMRESHAANAQFVRFSEFADSLLALSSQPHMQEQGAYLVRLVAAIEQIADVEVRDACLDLFTVLPGTEPDPWTPRAERLAALGARSASAADVFEMCVAHGESQVIHSLPMVITNWPEGAPGRMKLLISLLVTSAREKAAAALDDIDPRRSVAVPYLRDRIAFEHGETRFTLGLVLMDIGGEESSAVNAFISADEMPGPAEKLLVAMKVGDLVKRSFEEAANVAKSLESLFEDASTVNEFLKVNSGRGAARVHTEENPELSLYQKALLYLHELAVERDDAMVYALASCQLWEVGIITPVTRDAVIDGASFGWGCWRTYALGLLRGASSSPDGWTMASEVEKNLSFQLTVPETSDDAFHALRELGPSEITIPQLLTLLAKGAVTTRRAAANCLAEARTGRSDALSALMFQMREDKDLGARCCCACAVIRLGPQSGLVPEARGILENALRSGTLGEDMANGIRSALGIS